MYDEKSCGAVLYTYDNNILKYLLIVNQDGIYGFPKGHMENDETEEEAALREIYEEVGIKAHFMNNFKEYDSYRLFSKEKNKEVYKQVIYFLSDFNKKDIVKQDEEITSYSIVTYEEAISLIQAESSRNILTKANQFILNKCNKIY